MFLLYYVIAQATTAPVNMMDYIERGGIIGLLTIIVVGALREWWVPGATHRRLLAESHAREQELKSMVFAGIQAAEQAVKVAKTNVP